MPFMEELAHIGIGRIDRRDLKHRGADIGGHDQQGENPTEQFHRHPLLGTAPAGRDQGSPTGGIFYLRFITYSLNSVNLA